MATFTAFNSAMVKTALISGAAAGANLAVAGIEPDDILLLVVHQDATNLLKTDLTAETTIASAGNLRTATTATTGGKVLVLWLDRSATEA